MPATPGCVDLHLRFSGTASHFTLAGATSLSRPTSFGKWPSSHPDDPESDLDSGRIGPAVNLCRWGFDLFSDFLFPSQCSCEVGARNLDYALPHVRESNTDPNRGLNPSLIKYYHTFCLLC